MDFDSYTDAINAHDWDAVVGHMTDGVTYEDVPLGETNHGRADVREFWARLVPEWSSDVQMVLLRHFETDTDYAVEWIFKGTHDGTAGQLPATGKPFAVHGLSIGRLENGLIKENKDFWNMAEFLGQVGLMPAPAQAEAPH